MPVVPMIAARKEGHGQLLQEITNVFEDKTSLKKIKLYYGSELEDHIKELEQSITQNTALAGRYPPRWLAIKLLEDDREVLSRLGINAIPIEAETLKEVGVGT
jgi:ferrous iron transport protein B